MRVMTAQPLLSCTILIRVMTVLPFWVEPKESTYVWIAKWESCQERESRCSLSAPESTPIKYSWYWSGDVVKRCPNAKRICIHLSFELISPVIQKLGLAKRATMSLFQRYQRRQFIDKFLEKVPKLVSDVGQLPISQLFFAY